MKIDFLTVALLVATASGAPHYRFNSYDDNTDYPSYTPPYNYNNPWYNYNNPWYNNYQYNRPWYNYNYPPYNYNYPSYAPAPAPAPSPVTVASTESNVNNMQVFIVTFNNAGSYTAGLQQFTNMGSNVKFTYPSINAVAVYYPAEQVQQLRRMAGVVSVEKDSVGSIA